MQRGDTRYPHRDYATAGGDPRVSDRANEAALSPYTDTPPQATGGSPVGMMACPIG
jgi:hypothetical protein